VSWQIYQLVKHSLSRSEESCIRPLPFPAIPIAISEVELMKQKKSFRKERGILHPAYAEGAGPYEPATPQ
jgi:hypothetical protein